MSSTNPTESTISPEILFLVKQQAKAIAQINALQKKVDQLEHTINGQKKSPISDNFETNCASSSSTKKLVTSDSSNSKDRIAISDDSGGEYSRATTTSDDDELSLLLDQIARRSQQLQTTQHISNRLTNLSISSSVCGVSGVNNVREVLPQTMQTFRSKRQSYSMAPTAQLSNQTPSRDPSVDRKVFSNFNNMSTQMAANVSTPVVQPSPSAPPMAGSPTQSPYNQSISALIFEPNVENVLKNLDDIIATEAIDSNKFSNASTLSQTYQRSQTSQHSSHSLYDNIGHNPNTVSSGSLLLNSNSNTCSSAANWQLERAKSLVKQREEREVDKQIRLNEEWLQNQLKADPKHFRRSNYIDSYKPTFR